ncbi:hypothetical protein TNCV_38411 [Trichonephila clavipes]|nr:hypothetical protein TNCV_38411 [Trichonephila clavipes]
MEALIIRRSASSLERWKRKTGGRLLTTSRVFSLKLRGDPSQIVLSRCYPEPRLMTGVKLAPCLDEFCEPRSDTVNQSVSTTHNTLRRAGPTKCHADIDVKITVLDALKPLSARSFTNSGLTIESGSLERKVPAQVSPASIDQGSNLRGPSPVAILLFCSGTLSDTGIGSEDQTQSKPCFSSCNDLGGGFKAATSLPR